MSKKNRIRLFSYEILYENASYVPSDAQIHYLKNVMRLTLDDEVFLFDGQNGEFRSVVADISKKSLTLQVQKKVYDFEKYPALVCYYDDENDYSMSYSASVYYSITYKDDFNED